MFVKFVKGAIYADRWRFEGSVVDVHEDVALNLVKEGCCVLSGGPAVDAKPAAEPGRRGPGRPKKEG